MNQNEQTPALAVSTRTAGAPPAGQPEFLTALKTVVDHLWDDESAAFGALPPAQRQNHLFQSLQILREALDSWNSTGGQAALAPSTGFRAKKLGGQNVR